MKKNLNIYFIIAISLFPAISFAQSASPTPANQQQMLISSQSGTDFSAYVGQQIDSRLSASSPSTGLDQFIGTEPTYNPTPYTDQSTVVSYARNPDSWTLKGTPLDFTGVEGFNNASFRRQGATLITPRHFITAQHFALANGTKVTFFDANGNPVTRTVVNSINVAYDINVGVLDRDVDSSIAYYPLIDYATLQNLLAKYYYLSFDIPIVTFNQFRQAYIRQMNYMDSLHIYHSAYTPSTNPLRASFSGDIIEGDSGQPLFLVIDGKPVLLATHSSSNFGYTLGNFVTQINSAINTLGSGGYSVSMYSPSASFAKYVPGYPAPAALNAVAVTSCLSPATTGQVTLSWTVPPVINYNLGSYSISVDGGTPTVINSQYLLPAGTGRLQYSESSLTPGAHSFSVKADYDNNNSSGAVTAQANVPNPCSNTPASQSIASTAASPSSSPAKTPPVVVQSNQGQNNISNPIATGSPSPSPSISPKPPASGSSASQSASSGASSQTGSGQTQVLSGGGGSGGSAGGGGGAIYYYNNAYSVNPPASNGGQIVLQTQVAVTGSSAASPAFNRNLTLGSTGTDVQFLQRILNILGYTVSKKGNGSVGNESMYFGPATKAALIRYQADNASAATGVYSTGFFGKATRAVLNAKVAVMLNQGGTAAPMKGAPASNPASDQNISVPANNQSAPTSQVRQTSVASNTPVAASASPVNAAPSNNSGFAEILGGAAKNINAGFHNFLHVFGL